jgi:hypothetical protein
MPKKFVWGVVEDTKPVMHASGRTPDRVYVKRVDDACWPMKTGPVGSTGPCPWLHSCDPFCAQQLPCLLVRPRLPHGTLRLFGLDVTLRSPQTRLRHHGISWVE